MDGACQPVPRGLLEVVDVPDGVPTTPVGRLGPFEMGVHGLPFSPFRLGEYLGQLRDGTLVEGGALLADRASVCGFRTFLYVRITPSGTTPVAVHR